MNALSPQRPGTITFTNGEADQQQHYDSEDLNEDTPEGDNQDRDARSHQHDPEQEGQVQQDPKLSFESLVSEKCFGSRDSAEQFMKKWSDDNLNPLVKVSAENKGFYM